LLRIWVALAIVLLAGFAYACGGDGGDGSPPDAVTTDDDDGPPPTLSATPQAVGLPFQDGDELITVRGHIYGPQNDVGVVFAHMLPADQTAWTDFAQEVAEAGYVTFTFDFRGFGESDGDQDFGKLDDDLRAAITHLRNPPFNLDTIFVVGASMGATTGLVVSATEDLAGVVAVSPQSQFEDQDALSVVGEVTEPKLFIASEGVEVDMLSLDELFAAAVVPKEQQTYPGDAHGTDILESENGDAMRARILQFLEENK
jgi:pimeloyl-ACP methyl ester carboxylesterase